MSKKSPPANVRGDLYKNESNKKILRVITPKNRIEEIKDKLRNRSIDGYRFNIKHGEVRVFNDKGRHISKIKYNEFLDLLTEVIQDAKRK